jgi:hypothetical protein
MLGPWLDRLPALSDEFRNAEPFPLVMVDGFLDEPLADGLVEEFPSIDSMRRSNDYMFGDKRAEATLADAGPTCRKLYDLLVSDDFAAILTQITGRELFVDPSLHGGGFHQGGSGSFLDTHVDFNIHPRHCDWLRTLNILLYLNRDWPAEYGGELLVRRRPTDEPRSIAPLFNRCVIMLTSDDTYHGYRKMTLPPGVTRKSIAAYAYENIAAGSTPKRTTSWAPEDAGVGKRFLARYWSQGSAAKEKLQSLLKPKH